jgi:hypothetical protein
MAQDCCNYPITLNTGVIVVLLLDVTADLITQNILVIVVLFII